MGEDDTWKSTFACETSNPDVEKCCLEEGFTVIAPGTDISKRNNKTSWVLRERAPGFNSQEVNPLDEFVVDLPSSSLVRSCAVAAAVAHVV